jgi:thiamine-monophosphate kinase
MLLYELGEIPLVERLQSLARQADDDLKIGIGDDCAVISRPDGKAWLLTTDCLVEDVHFRLGFTTLEDLGAKAVAVNVSDIAAMGGTPRFGLVTLGLPRTTPVSDVEALYMGIRRSCEHYGVSLVGGDTTRAPQMLLSVVLLGEQDEASVVSRSSASVGDLIYVTGTLGDSVLGLALLEEGETPGSTSADVRWLVQRHLVPHPRARIGRSLAESGLASAMIDISDGLSTDLRRLCTASGVGARIELERLPRSSPLKAVGPERGLDPLEVALRGGEDYELLFTVPEEKSEALATELPRSGPLLTRIGVVTPAEDGLVVQQLDGLPRALSEEGYNHFRAAQ